MDGGIIFILICAGVLIWLYLIPWEIAATRKHPQSLAILVLNILAGWTFIGWVACLVWAFIKTEAPVVSVGLTPKQVEEKLTLLGDLHSKGLITETELQIQRADVLRQATPASIKSHRGSGILDKWDRLVSIALHGGDGP